MVPYISITKQTIRTNLRGWTREMNPEVQNWSNVHPSSCLQMRMLCLGIQRQELGGGVEECAVDSHRDKFATPGLQIRHF